MHLFTGQKYAYMHILLLLYPGGPRAGREKGGVGEEMVLSWEKVGESPPNCCLQTVLRALPGMR
jgi:hypothetical protein